jgi:hypothetical protein
VSRTRHHSRTKFGRRRFKKIDGDIVRKDSPPSAHP